MHHTHTHTHTTHICMCAFVHIHSRAIERNCSHSWLFCCQHQSYRCSTAHAYEIRTCKCQNCSYGLFFCVVGEKMALKAVVSKSKYWSEVIACTSIIATNTGVLDDILGLLFKEGSWKVHNTLIIAIVAWAHICFGVCVCVCMCVCVRGNQRESLMSCLRVRPGQEPFVV